MTQIAASTSKLIVHSQQGPRILPRNVCSVLLLSAIFCFLVLWFGVAVCAAFGIENHRPTDVELSFFVASKDQFWQESQEKFLFVAFCLSTLVALVAAPNILKLRERAASVEHPPFALYFILFVCLLVLWMAHDDSLGFGASVTSYTLPALAWLVWPSRWLSQLLVILMLLAAWWASESTWLSPQRRVKFARILVSLGWFSALIIAYRLSWIQTPSLLGWTPSIAHESLLVQPIYEVLQGFTVFVDTTSQYGGFAQVAALGGGFGLDARSSLLLLMALVLGIELILLFELLRRTTSAFWALVGLLAVLWFTPVAFTDFLLFQCMHLRWLFPLLTLFCANGVHTGHTRYCSLGWALLPCALYWNPETGIASVAAWCSFLVWQLWSKRIRFADALIPSAWAAFVVVLIAVACVIRTGQLPNVLEAVSYLQIFALAGFGMLPLTFMHWWIIYALLALGALIYARLNPANEVSGLLWTSGSFCFLLFPYFLGRSFVTNLLWISYPAVIICVVVIARGRSSLGRLRYVAAPLLIAAASATVSTPFAWPTTINESTRTQAQTEREKIRAFVASTRKSASLSEVSFLSPQTYALEEMFSLPARPLPPALSATLLVSQAAQWERYAFSAKEVYLDDAFWRAAAQLEHPWSAQFLASLNKRFVWDAELVVSGSRIVHGVARLPVAIQQQ